jgi:hypothetical protein
MKLSLVALCIPLYACSGSPFAEIYEPDSPGYFGSPDQYVGLHPDAGSDQPDAEAGQQAEAALDVTAESALDVTQEDAPDVGPTCTHSNGLGGTYTDCADPLGMPGNASTYTYAMSGKAVASWVYASGAVGDIPCGGGTSECRVVMSTLPSSSATWCYTGPLAGYVTTGPAWTCPTTASAVWQ